MSRTIIEELEALAEDFDAFGDDWEERYRYVIDLGRELEDLTETERSEANKVRDMALHLRGRGPDGKRSLSA